MIINRILYFPLLAAFFIIGLSVPKPAMADEQKSYFTAGTTGSNAKTGKQVDSSLSQMLIYRVAFGKAGDVQIMLDKGADPEAKNIADVPVLTIAAERKDEQAPAIVEALIKAGANVNEVTKEGEVAVLQVVKNGRPDILQILIDHRAVLGAVHDTDGKDLLSIAEKRGNLDIVKILNAGLENEKDKIENLKSVDNFINLIQKYAFLSCSNEYLNFYISNQPQGVNMVAFNNVITENSGEISDTGRQIKMLFRMHDYELQQIQSAARNEVIMQLQHYETNQNRTLNGIGTDKDLNNRCWKIAKKWDASKLNLDQYRHNTQ